jgi:transcriptional regulator with XRE-family HTH domain
MTLSLVVRLFAIFTKATIRRAEIADIVGVSAKHLSRVINGHVNLTI